MDLEVVMVRSCVGGHRHRYYPPVADYASVGSDGAWSDGEYGAWEFSFVRGNDGAWNGGECFSSVSHCCCHPPQPEAGWS